MPEVQETPKTKTKVKAKVKAKEASKGEKGERTRLLTLYPEDAKFTLLVDSNPKRPGSKAAARFEGYFGSKTLGEAYAKGVTPSDVAYDVSRKRIEVG